jgi:peptidoglycan/LPS O-acetylase OafA/YrhL
MYFVGGMAFYLMYRFRPTGLLWGIVGFSWLQTQYMMAYQAPLAAATTRSTQHWWISVPLVTVFYAIMASVALGWLSWARWRWLTVAGALTYPLYLLHDVIGFTLIRWLHESIPKWPLLLGLLAAMLLTSWLVHRYFERPVSVRLKRWIQQGLTDIRANELKMRHAADRPLVPEEPTRGRHASTGAPHTRPIGHILVAEHAIAPATNLADP